MGLYKEKSIEGKRVSVTDYFMAKVRKVQKTKNGTIVGCILHNKHHSYIYQAFHVRFDDGTEDTVWAHNYKLVSNGYSRY